MLHKDRENFEQVILKVSEDTGIDASIIEKDYYVTLFLKRIVEVLPNIIFKGGTSLSKCYKLIKRFSEDIDLNIEVETRPTEGQRKKLKEAIVSIIDPEAVRHLIYTTNAIEGFNRQLRKVTKSKTVFPSDDSLLKMLYLATLDITKKWTGHRQDWGQIHSQLEIYFEERLIGHNL